MSCVSGILSCDDLNMGVNEWTRTFTCTVNLKQAIQAMPNITSFRWEGRCPLPGAAVLAALANSSGHVLRELYLP